MAEEGTKNEGISDAEKLCNVMDAVSEKLDSLVGRMDRQDARMDANEESFKKWASEEGKEKEHKEDSKRKDESEEEKKEEAKDAKKDEDGDKREDEEVEEKGKPKETAADKRKDSEEEKKEEAKEDRKDAKKDTDAEEMAEADSLKGQMADLRSKIAELQGRVPAMLSDGERERFAAIQEQADPAFQAFGDRAPGPLDGESPTQYKRRLGSKMQGHSPKWKESRLSAVADDAMLDVVVSEIFADSITAATRGADVPAGQLHARKTTSDAGHTYIDYFGDPKALSSQFRGRALRAGTARH